MPIIELLSRFIPNPAGALWLGAIVSAVVFADRDRVLSPRNLALGALLSPGVFLAHIVTYRLDAAPRAAPLLYSGVYLATAGMAVWGFALARNVGNREPWRPNLPPAVLRAMVLVLLALDTVVTIGRRPDDAGIYSGLGAARWFETGRLPYSDPLLKGAEAPGYGAAATYGPLLYASQLPFQAVTGSVRNPAEAVPKDRGGEYRWPPELATKLASLAFFLLGAWALFLAARGMAGTDTALGVLVLWLSSPYVIGLGGDKFEITGLGFISHIAPSATMMLAVAGFSSAALSGALFAASAGVLFFPAFLFPAWFAWRAKLRDGSWRPFLLGFGAAALALVALVVWFTPPLDGKGPIRLFLESTLEHQEGMSAREYGASQDSFWGTHPGAAAFWQHPLIAGTSLFKPTFLLFAAAALGSVAWVRGRSVAQLAAITAALGAAIQLWKTHATGSYVEWYLPFLLLALICGNGVGRAATGDEAPTAGSGRA